MRTKEFEIWTYPKSREPIIPQSFSLVELMHGIPSHKNPMVQEGSCFVTGIKFVKSGTKEAENIINTVRKTLKVFMPDQELEENVKKLQGLDVLAVGTNFRAMRYPHADGCKYQGFITDMNTLAVVYFDTKEITLMPFGDPEEGPNSLLFYDVYGARSPGSRWQYSGKFEDALNEFSRIDYSFNVSLYPNGLSEKRQLVNANLPNDREYLDVKKNVFLKEALKIVSSL